MGYGLGRGRSSCAALAVSIALASAAGLATASAATGAPAQSGAPVQGAAAAPSTAPAVPALTVDEIVARHVEALGGAERLAAVRSLRLTGADVIGGGDFRIDAEWALLVARPGQVRSEVSLQGLTAIDAFDGKDGWSVQPFDGRRDAQKTSADEAKDLAREAEPRRPARRAGARRATASSTSAPRTSTARRPTSCASRARTATPSTSTSTPTTGSRSAW